jgi:fructose-1,6-bisphosphatase
MSELVFYVYNFVLNIIKCLANIVTKRKICETMSRKFIFFISKLLTNHKPMDHSQTFPNFVPKILNVS